MKKALVLLLALAPGIAGAQVQTRLLYPAAGAILHPGQTIVVRWEVTLPPLPIPGCEQELMLSLDGGRTNAIRMSRMLSPNTRQVAWTVPDVASRNAVIDLRYGCDGSVIEPPVDVPQFPQLQARFVIAPASPGPLEGVALVPFEMRTVAPGDTAFVSWQSSVARVQEFEVFVSYDRGAHFHSLGTTTATDLEWTAPKEMFGGVTFQVVARRADGTSVASPVPARVHLTVR
jgi:hypothetical protein